MSFMPWMGSKRLLVPQLLKRLPPRFARYHELFVGSGALLYALRPDEAFASDELRWVVELHQAVHQDADGLAERYGALALGGDRRATFSDIRSRFPDVQPHEFLFLIRNCHGSRFRVNRRGLFNSPFNASPQRAAAPTGRAVASEQARIRRARLPGRVDFAAADYRARLHLVRPGDLCFVDPPYAWQEGKEPDYGGVWGPEGWRQLVEALAGLPAGVSLMITLHGSMPEEEVARLLAPIAGVRIAPLALAGAHLKRGGVEQRCEWLATNY